MSSIIALVYVSLSELQTINPMYTEEWVDNNEQQLLGVLHGLGLDTKLQYERQIETHRNRFGNVNTCSRFVGNERLDDEWINSEYSSQEAKDKKLGNKLVFDMYRLRGMTE